MSDAGDPEVAEITAAPEEAERAYRLEQERIELVAAVASSPLDTVGHRVGWILDNYPEARNSDITLQLRYWETFCPPALDDARTVQQFLAERESQQWTPDTFYERCPSCGRRGDSYPDCEPKRLRPYAAALLSAIVPGLGQIVNGAFLVAVWAVAVWDAWASADTRRWRWGIRAA